MEINKNNIGKMFSPQKKTEVSWYQEKPETSLQFFERNKIPKLPKF